MALLTTNLSTGHGIDEAGIPRHRARWKIPPEAAVAQLKSPVPACGRGHQVNHIAGVEVAKVAPQGAMIGQLERDVVVLQRYVAALGAEDLLSTFEQESGNVASSEVDPRDNSEQDHRVWARHGPHVVRFMHQCHPRIRRPEAIVTARTGEPQLFALNVEHSLRGSSGKSLQPVHRGC